GGGTRATESAVLMSLKWLARHQNADGSWSPDGFEACCKGGPCGGKGEKEGTIGATSLSLLGFLGAGYSQLSKDEFPDPVEPARVLKFGEVVKSAMRFLLSKQDPDGCVGERVPRHLYSHAMATLALSEAYGMTAAAVLKEPAQKAVDFLVAAQNPGKGWRYSSKSGDNDTSVTGWAVMALKSAELSNLTFPRTAYEGAVAWFDSVTDEKGRAGYNAKGTGKVFIPGINENFDPHETMTAFTMLGRIFIEKRKADPRLGLGANLLVADLPEMNGNKIDFYYWYAASLALFQYDGPEGPMWKTWNEPMKNTLVPAQKSGKDGCKNGSWDPIDRWSAEGGRVYATALNTLTLEVYYRYANVFGGKK